MNPTTTATLRAAALLLARAEGQASKGLCRAVPAAAQHHIPAPWITTGGMAYDVTKHLNRAALFHLRPLADVPDAETSLLSMLARGEACYRGVYGRGRRDVAISTWVARTLTAWRSGAPYLPLWRHPASTRPDGREPHWITHEPRSAASHLAVHNRPKGRGPLDTLRYLIPTTSGVTLRKYIVMSRITVSDGSRLTRRQVIVADNLDRAIAHASASLADRQQRNALWLAAEVISVRPSALLKPWERLALEVAHGTQADYVDPADAPHIEARRRRPHTSYGSKT